MNAVDNEGRDRDDSLERAARRWSLTLGERYSGASAGSITVRAIQVDGTPVVLKVQMPHRESDHEADALRVWNGDGAVRLLDADADDHALLLERCTPGTAPAGPDALGVIIHLLPRLWVPAGPPITALADEAAWWSSYLAPAWERRGRPFERRVLDAALDALASLVSDQGEQVLLNQDLHAGNVLSAEREPWLVIDPKPLIGEREFGVAPVVRDAPPASARRRLDRMTADLDLDRDRARGWAIAQAVAWCFDSSAPGGVRRGHIETARRLIS